MRFFISVSDFFSFCIEKKYLNVIRTSEEVQGATEKRQSERQERVKVLLIIIKRFISLFQLEYTKQCEILLL